MQILDIIFITPANVVASTAGYTAVLEQPVLYRYSIRVKIHGAYRLLWNRDTSVSECWLRATVRRTSKNGGKVAPSGADRQVHWVAAVDHHERRQGQPLL